MKALVSNINKRTERVFLVGAQFGSRSIWEIKDSLEELAQLTTTAGGVVIGEGVQKFETPVAGTFIGSGKAREFGDFCRANDVDTIIFDDELSPAQSRNLEEIFQAKILDRTSLILDIFAQRARTREGKLQIELAQLQHLLPRLTRYWSHLSRQKGGIGMRGEGETQLETDRRRVQVRIDKIEEDLHLVRRHRSTQRLGRKRTMWPLTSIVGYTNAGKSTLLNRLTGAATLVEDKLFATLDPTTRRLRLPTNQNVLISDTVGFIRKLPHQLVEAFKATLEEVVEADLIMHVVDLSHPKADLQMEAVRNVLDEIGAGEKPALTVFNKIDLITAPAVIERHLEKFHPAVAVSATTGAGIPELLHALGLCLRPIRDILDLEVPHQESAVLARLHSVGQVVEHQYEGDMVRLRVHLPPHWRAEFEKFIARGPGDPTTAGPQDH